MSQSASRKDGEKQGAKNIPQPNELCNKSRRTATQNPTKFSRNQENHELQNLKDSIADYSGRVKFLEAKNSKLTQKLHFSNEVRTREVSNAMTLCESELDKLRNALECEVEQKNRLELENRRHIFKIKQLNTKLDQISKELEETKSFEARYREITVKYGQALIDNKNLKDANNAIETTQNQQEKGSLMS
ncbi:lamin Dm0-like [Rhopalosiphum maidis]|uniref:lamin Dm0-like n=1 Tax=Rhopalosiphum maidis TaxID=43146 RepID=UPI000EFEEB00|nr:lamin Dm0-like [Rhopalosiphum maidis]